MPPILQTPIFKIIIYVVASIVLGALLTPLFYNVGQHVLQWGGLEGKAFLGLNLHGEIEKASLSRFFNRAMLVAALLCLWPAIKWLNVHPREFLQLQRNPHRWLHGGFGFAIAAGGLLLLGWGLVNVEMFKMIKPEKRDPVLEILFASLVSAVAVGLLEEFFFRGCLLGLAMQTFKPMTSLAIVSVFFSAVHFLKLPDDIAPAQVDWTTGFWLLGQIIAQFGNPVFIIAEFTTLFMVGWILGYTRLRTNSLWLAIGLHAGWVFGIKVFAALTRRNKDFGDTLPWVGQDLKSGVIALVIVTLTGAATWFLLQKTWPSKREPDA